VWSFFLSTAKALDAWERGRGLWLCIHSIVSGMNMVEHPSVLCHGRLLGVCLLYNTGESK
jgi:hypothetical protein